MAERTRHREAFERYWRMGGERSLERFARGEPTDRQEVQGEVGINARLTSISDEELDRLLEYTEGALDGEGETEPE